MEGKLLSSLHFKCIRCRGHENAEGFLSVGQLIYILQVEIANTDLSRNYINNYKVAKEILVDINITPPFGPCDDL